MLEACAVLCCAVLCFAVLCCAMLNVLAAVFACCNIYYFGLKHCNLSWPLLLWWSMLVSGNPVSFKLLLYSTDTVHVKLHIMPSTAWQQPQMLYTQQNI